MARQAAVITWKNRLFLAKGEVSGIPSYKCPTLKVEVK